VVDVKDVLIHLEGASSDIPVSELAGPPSRKSSSSSSSSSKKSDHAVED
jgi:hypothetical protein